ncbi:MAG: flagellin [Bacillota bacterium]
MRISTHLFYKNLLSSIHREHLGAARVQEQIASGRRINRLSEDPAALSQMLTLRTATSEIRDYVLGIDLQRSRLNRAEEALAQATQVMQDARVMAVQGATGTYSPSDLKNLAFEVDRMITALVGFANASRGGVKPEGLFERTVVDGQEMVVYTPPDVWLEQVPGDGWSRVLTLNMLVETIDPGQVFGVEEYVDGENNIVLRATMFDALFDLRDRLMAGDQSGVAGLIGVLEGHIDTLLQGRGDLGSRGYQLEKLQAQIQIQNEQLTEVLSKIGDTDVAEAVIRINRHELVLQATLSTAARLMHVSLLNYLR